MNGKSMRHVLVVFAGVLMVPAWDAAAAPKGIWVSQAEIDELPASGAAWNAMKDAADEVSGMSAECSWNSIHDTHTMAAGLVAARLNSDSYREITANAIRKAINARFEDCSHADPSLAVTRSLAGYFIAADVMDLASYDPALEADVRTEVLQNGLTRVYDTRHPG